jgi:hypothetical protein
LKAPLPLTTHGIWTVQVQWISTIMCHCFAPWHLLPLHICEGSHHNEISFVILINAFDTCYRTITHLPSPLRISEATMSPSWLILHSYIVNNRDTSQLHFGVVEVQYSGEVMIFFSCLLDSN